MFQIHLVALQNCFKKNKYISPLNIMLYHTRFHLVDKSLQKASGHSRRSKLCSRKNLQSKHQLTSSGLECYWHDPEAEERRYPDHGVINQFSFLHNILGWSRWGGTKQVYKVHKPLRKIKWPSAITTLLAYFTCGLMSYLSKYVNIYIPTQTPKEDMVAICNHQTDSPLYVWPDVLSGIMHAYKRVWLHMKLNVLLMRPGVGKQAF